MGPGHKHHAPRAGNCPRLITGVDPLRVVAEQDVWIRAVGIADPKPVVIRRRAIDVVPPRVDDPAVGEHRRMPLVGLVKRQRPHLARGLQAVQRVGRQRLPGIVAAPKTAPPRGHESQPAVGQRAGIEVVVGAEGQLAEVTSIAFHGVQMERPSFARVVARLGRRPFAEGEVERLRVIRQSRGRIVAPREPALDQVSPFHRAARFLEYVNAAAVDIAVVVVIAEILVEHLGDEPPPLEEHQRFTGEERILEGRAPQRPTDLEIDVPPRGGAAGF